MTSGPAMPDFPASALLSLCELFGDVDPELLTNLDSELQIVRLGRGEILMSQGDPADCMYAVVSGRLQLFADTGDATERLLAELRSGETVGELDLIDGRPRMATVRAVRDSELVRVSRLGFEKLVRRECRLAEQSRQDSGRANAGLGASRTRRTRDQDDRCVRRR